MPQPTNELNKFNEQFKGQTFSSVLHDLLEDLKKDNSKSLEQVAEEMKKDATIQVPPENIIGKD